MVAFLRLSAEISCCSYCTSVTEYMKVIAPLLHRVYKGDFTSATEYMKVIVPLLHTAYEGDWVLQMIAPARAGKCSALCGINRQPFIIE